MARKQKTELDNELEKAKTSGKYMISIWYRTNDELKHYRLTTEFPIKDIPLALDMLKKDLDKISQSIPQSKKSE